MKPAARFAISSDPEEKAVADAIDEVWEKRPSYVKSYKLETGEDHTGDPAIWIYLKVTRDNNPSRQKVVALRKFANEVEQKVLDRKLHRWPYVHFTEGR